MALDLATMQTALLTRLGNPATDGFFTSAQTVDLINEALQAYATEQDWPWLQATETLTTVAGSAAGLTPAAGWTRTKSLVIDGSNPLEMLSLGELRSVPTSVRGQPTRYCIEVEKVLLRPVPDAVYSVTHDYFTAEPALVSGTDAPLLPERWRYCIVEFATYLAHLRQGRTNEAQAALAGYAGWLSRMRDQRRRSTSTLKVKVRPGTGF